MELEKVIREELETSPKKRITFERFMDLALYHPDHGYYTSGTVEIGARGDFFTSSSLGTDFGELLAEQFVEMAEILDARSFTLVEVGAGSGVLARDILDYLRRQHAGFYENLRYIIVEQSPGLIDRQRETLRECVDIIDKVCWKTWEELDSIEGCIFSNELIDAFPVHQVVIQSGELREIYVTANGETFEEVVGELSTDDIRAYFELVGVKIPSDAYPEGYRTEVNLGALRWLETVSAKIDRGYLVSIDYGYPAEKYYHPQRYRGTLQCYFQHKRHENPYLYIGQQDITTHIDFTALERQGEKVGLSRLGFTRQGMFLMALGLGDRLLDLSSPKVDIATVFRRRDALHQLIDPTGLGGFGVMIQGKRVPDRVLRGLREG
ncbi:SAM-dependent methyltransferase [Pannus brasiliensis CCIBt3594]|uniref:SAM-dependent methyltransferase n=1 Tax=Pannus brasiliensis CCIBt3594 TaxID=1427578 RepID=A0AAW9QWR9_9CHRO